MELIPISIVRFRRFSNHKTHPAEGIVVMFFFAAAGLVNAFLYFVTGRSFGLAERPGQEQEAPVERVELSEYPGSSITEEARDVEAHR